MASGTIKIHHLYSKGFDHQITWASTTNPYYNGTQSIKWVGYIPIRANFMFTGTASSFIALSQLQLMEEAINISCRMYNQTPSSTTQNTIYVSVYYLQNIE